MPHRTYPTSARQLGTTMRTPFGLDRVGLAIPGTGRVRGLGPATAEGAAGRGQSAVPSGADVRAGTRMPATLHVHAAAQLQPAPSAPPYHELTASVQLTSAQLAAHSCPISLDDGDALLEPVALRSEPVLHVFAYELLWQHWLLRGDNPLTRQPFGWGELLRVEVQVAQNDEAPGFSCLSAVDAADGPPPEDAASSVCIAGGNVPGPLRATSP